MEIEIDRDTRLKFLNLIKIEEETDCYRWLGEYNSNDEPVFKIEEEKDTKAILLMFLFFEEEFNFNKNHALTCGNEDFCINPEHVYFIEPPTPEEIKARWDRIMDLTEVVGNII